jgi:hypothetical protein
MVRGMENETPMQKVGMREHRKGQAKAYFLQHPEASISEALADLHRRGVNISERTVAQARSELAQKDLLPKGRNSSPAATSPANVSLLPPIGDTLLNDKTLGAAAEGDLTDIFDLDDESIRKKLLRGVITIALTPDVHPDTQLSATTVWSKLKDMARVAELGPGKPVTREQAIDRLSELMSAVGSEISMAAMYKAFNLKENPDGEEKAVEAPPSGGTTEDSGATNHDPPAAPPQDGAREV